MGAYPAVLLLHAWLRWAVLLVGLVLLARTAVGWRRRRSWTRGDELSQIALTALLDLQLLLGFGLYVALSPLVRAFLADPATAMHAPALRFFAVEHAAVMLAAVVVAHVGRVLARGSATPAGRQARSCLTTVVVLLLVLAAIPWPSQRYGRPLFRTGLLPDTSVTVASYITK